MRIVHVITGLSTGGAEMALYRLLPRGSSNYKSHVISLSTIGEVGRRIQEMGIPVEALGMKPGMASLFSILHLVKRLTTLQPDIVHTWMYHADLVGGVAGKLASVPKVTWAIRNSDLSADKTKVTTRAVVKICALLSHYLPDKIISCSFTARDIHVALGYDESRFVIIPNGFDLCSFRQDSVAYREVRDELGIPADAPVVGLVARLDPQKNHHGFFEAAGILHNLRRDVHFVLAGGSIEANNPHITASVRKAGIKDVTHLLGLRNDIPRLTAAFDIAASSSWGEAFPNVVGEAMACGVPCVVTDVGDSAYIVGDTGRVVPPGDMKKFAGAIYDLLALSSTERKVLGESARARVTEHFEICNVVKRYELFYDDLSESGMMKREMA